MVFYTFLCQTEKTPTAQILVCLLALWKRQRKKLPEKKKKRSNNPFWTPLFGGGIFLLLYAFCSTHYQSRHSLYRTLAHLGFSFATLTGTNQNNSFSSHCGSHNCLSPQIRRTELVCQIPNGQFGQLKEYVENVQI